MALPVFLDEPTIIAGEASVDEAGGAIGLANGGVGFLTARYGLIGHDTNLEAVTLALMDGVTGQVEREVTLRGFGATGVTNPPQAMLLEDGRILVSWLGSFNLTTGRDCFFRIFDAAGRPEGEVTQIDPRDAGQGSAGLVDTTALANGGFVAAWEQYVNGSWESYARAYGADGLPAGDVIRLNRATDGSQGAPQITALAGGGFMAVWQEEFNPSLPPGDKVLVGRIFAADGSPVARSFVISESNAPGSDYAQAHAVTELAGGGIAVTWHHAQEPEDPGMEWLNTVKVRLFDANGQALGAEFVVSQADPSAFNSANPVIAALQDGRFMVAWTQYENGTGASQVMGRIVNADGSFSSNAFDLAPGSDLAPSNPSLAVLADGRVMVTYGVMGAGSWGQDLLSQLLDPREAAIDVKGTGGGDGLVGTGFADRIAGGNGRDHLLGADGADRLLGQAGNDTLEGGGGKDRITGGGGADELTGGLGRDVFIFAAGEGSDRVTDFAIGQDRLDLRAFGFADVAEALSHFTQGRDATLFEFGGTVILLDGLGLSALDGGSLLV